MDRFKYLSHEGVRYAVSENIGCPHAFSTRDGGLSRLPHTASLNLVYGRGDDENTVDANRVIFARAAGVPWLNPVEAEQIHSAAVAVVGGQLPERNIRCDGFVSDRDDVTLCVKTADCAPILFHDGSAGIIGACHAGWRGTVAGIAGKTLDAMCALGADRSRVQIAIGACIHECCYEVGEDFYHSVCEAQGVSFAKEYVRIKDGRYHADITGMNIALLTAAGAAAENISVDGNCTCCHPDIYFSHRATHGLRGTMMAIISGGTR